MGWFDASVLVAVGLVGLAAGVWASRRIGEALDWLSDDLREAARLSDTDAAAMRRELISR
jgi:hypothetical protein